MEKCYQGLGEYVQVIRQGVSHHVPCHGIHFGQCIFFHVSNDNPINPVDDPNLKSPDTLPLQYIQVQFPTSLNACVQSQQEGRRGVEHIIREEKVKYWGG